MYASSSARRLPRASSLLCTMSSATFNTSCSISICLLLIALAPIPASMRLSEMSYRFRCRHPNIWRRSVCSRTLCLTRRHVSISSSLRLWIRLSSCPLRSPWINIVGPYSAVRWIRPTGTVPSGSFVRNTLASSHQSYAPRRTLMHLPNIISPQMLSI